VLHPNRHRPSRITHRNQSPQTRQPRERAHLHGIARDPVPALRRSYRDENGKRRNETLANLSALPDNAIAALRLALRGATLFDAESVFDVERSVPHGNVAAAHVMAEKLELRPLLGPPSKDRDVAYALILSRAVRPRSKLSTVRWRDSGDTTVAADLGATTDDVYNAMDWLLGQKGAIEKRLARRHLRGDGIAMYDLSSSWVEGSCCGLAAFGYSRDGERGRAQIEYGLPTDPEGRPVAGSLKLKILDLLLDRLRRLGLVAAGARQRTDSTHVLGRIRSLNRLELAGEIIWAALEALAVAVPDWLATVIDASWQQVYGQRIDEIRLPGSDTRRTALAVQYGKDGYHLLEAVRAPGAPESGSLPAGSRAASQESMSGLPARRQACTCPRHSRRAMTAKPQPGARHDSRGAGPDSQPLAAKIANRLAGTYTVSGTGRR
jgi:hypothetical protein